MTDNYLERTYISRPGPYIFSKRPYIFRQDRIFSGQDRIFGYMWIYMVNEVCFHLLVWSEHDMKCLYILKFDIVILNIDIVFYGLFIK